MGRVGRMWVEMSQQKPRRGEDMGKTSRQKAARALQRQTGGSYTRCLHVVRMWTTKERAKFVSDDREARKAESRDGS